MLEEEGDYGGATEEGDGFQRRGKRVEKFEGGEGEPVRVILRMRVILRSEERGSSREVGVK